MSRIGALKGANRVVQPAVKFESAGLGRAKLPGERTPFIGISYNGLFCPTMPDNVQLRDLYKPLGPDVAQFQ